MARRSSTLSWPPTRCRTCRMSTLSKSENFAIAKIKEAVLAVTGG
jgi:hypothetical protein